MNPRVAENAVYSTPQYWGGGPGWLALLNHCIYLTVNNFESPNGFVVYYVAFPTINMLA